MALPQFRELAEVAGAHHEKSDGTGYPNRLSGRDLSLEARILGTTDIYGALTEDRPYRSGFSPAEALKIMERGVPGKLDAECFGALSSVAEAGSETAAGAALPGTPTPTVASAARGLHADGQIH